MTHDSPNSPIFSHSKIFPHSITIILRLFNDMVLLQGNVGFDGFGNRRGFVTFLQYRRQFLLAYNMADGYLWNCFHQVPIPKMLLKQCLQKKQLMEEDFHFQLARVLILYIQEVFMTLIKVLLVNNKCLPQMYHRMKNMFTLKRHCLLSTQFCQ